VILSQKLRQGASWGEFFSRRERIPSEELEGFMEGREQGIDERDHPLE